MKSLCARRMADEPRIRKRPRTESETQKFGDNAQQQIFIVGCQFMSCVGRSVSVRSNLTHDVLSLCEAFAWQSFGCKTDADAWIDALQILQENAVFVFGGKQLEPGSSLWDYGVRKGSNVHITWRLKSAQEIPIHVIVHTPFTDVRGLLLLRGNDNQLDTTIDTSMFRFAWKNKFHPTSSLRLFFAPAKDPSDSSFVNSTEDVWKRLNNDGETLSRIHVMSKQVGRTCPFGVHMGRNKIVKSLTCGDGMKVREILQVDGILFVPLLREREQIVYDTTEPYWGFESCNKSLEDCCICLEPMTTFQRIRRLPCMHSLHAACALHFLPKSLKCPLCRHGLQPDHTCDLDDEMEDDSYDDMSSELLEEMSPMTLYPEDEEDEQQHQQA